MKSVILSIVVLLAITVSQLQADEKPKTKIGYESSTGEFLIEPSNNELPQICVMHNSNSGGKYGEVFGTITKDTKITIVNRPNFKKADLDLLNGKQVTIIGKYRQVGEGEGSEIWALELIIHLK